MLAFPRYKFEEGLLCRVCVIIPVAGPTPHTTAPRLKETGGAERFLWFAKSMRDPGTKPCFTPDVWNCADTSVEHPEVGQLYLSLGLSLLCCVLCGLGAFLLAQLRREAPEPEALDEEGQLAPSQGPDLPFPKVAVPKQILDWAAAEPDRVCLVAEGKELTYHDLLLLSRRCAAKLLQLFAESGEHGGRDALAARLVALYLQPGPALVAAVLGTWLAKSAWTPLDRKSPALRIRELVKQVNPQAVICDDQSPFEQLEVPVVHMNKADKATPAEIGWEGSLDSLAQVIYTSGSTGTPKGVIFSHGRLAHSTHFFAEQCGVGLATRVLQKTPNIWSVFRHEVYPALCRGGVVVHPDPLRTADPVHLGKVIGQNQVSLLVATPAVLDLVLDANELMPTLRYIVCMGEPLSWSMAEKVYRSLPFVNLMNFYGSTETENTTFTVPKIGGEEWQRCKGRAVPAGRPQPHVHVYLLEPGSLEPSSPGEICFSGIMADGYFGAPELTARSFVEHPTLGRLYRTGDLGQWSHQQLTVLGRIDRQVKIRGARVELQELELTLAPLVSAICAVAAEGEEGHLHIVAFVVTEDLEALKEQARSRLSAALMPTLFQALPSLPRLANGKVDMQGLKALASEALAEAQREAESETTTALDSLGMLQHLTKSQLEEDRWVQNQQAFWTLIVMMAHFALIQGAGEAGRMTIDIESALSHGKDMSAFVLLLGFADARNGPQLSTRDGAALVLALSMTFVLPWILRPPCLLLFGSSVAEEFFSPYYPRVQHEWFLYSYLFARVVLVLLSRFGEGLWQAVLVLSLACMLPDDVLWLQLSLKLRRFLRAQDHIINFKGLRWATLFVAGIYLLSYHLTRAGLLTRCRRTGGRRLKNAEAWLERRLGQARGLRASLCLACWVLYLALSLVSGIDPKLGLGRFGYQDGFQAVYKEGNDWTLASHSVSWHYMTHPSLMAYVLLWIGELLQNLLPCVAVGVAMALMPWHFKTMGSTCFGNYVIHVYLAQFSHFAEQPVLSRITRPEWGLKVNFVITFSYNIIVCLLFAHTVGVAFHHLLVGVMKAFTALLQRKKG
ncbi:unnamed protein product [Effrenium voratum]|uniref:AMP-dependent synthetase/ligase domain-containing protein n=1 Tax=Effrenium voratum TaxID=2562239 RepID=A0AA36ID29_9DINO|nr:unnamed protein product [Effrenium voratum]CAJ1424240.1 unnamed protein product [Effrenium voratum]